MHVPEGLQVIVGLAVACGSTFAWAAPPDGLSTGADGLPRLGRADGYVTSNACRECHRDEHASWHASYHRTMTQVASPETVVGRFDDVLLAFGGRSYRLARREDEFWVQMIDPDGAQAKRARGRVGGEGPRVWKRVVMTTGSHHMQVYWVPGRPRGVLHNFPFLYHIGEQRWIPREAAFLRAPQMGPIGGVWNDNCIDCHSVGGQPGLDFRTGQFDTRVAELGIACEACHGPGKEHVRVARDGRVDANASIVNPADLTAKQSAQVCGQCHGVTFVKDIRDWLGHGFRYRPGEDLAKTRHILQPAENRDAAWVKRLAAEWPTVFDELFWSDGMIRVSGREFNGLVGSSCYEGGKLSCLSCHSMHRSEPNDQLARGMDGNRACLQCHESMRDAVPAHTHHAADSSGSLCYNCHMPHTTYGLLKAIRSHQIDSPRVATSLKTGRPTACNLCHLDKTLAWTAKHLSTWFGAPSPVLTDEQQSVSAALLWMLRGDAGQRALIAWHMGWDSALDVSGRRWLAPFLAELLNDPYPAVRFVAYRSLRRLPSYDDIPYDFVGTADQRTRSRRDVLDRWLRVDADRTDRTGPAVLIDADGGLDEAAVERLLRQRDDRPVYLAE